MIDRSPRTGFEVGRRPAAAQAVPKRVGPSVSAKPAPRRPHQPQPKFRWRPAATAAQRRRQRVGLLAERRRSAPPPTRAREISAIKVNDGRTDDLVRASQWIKRRNAPPKPLVFQCRLLAMTRYLAGAARPQQQHHHQQRSPRAPELLGRQRKKFLSKFSIRLLSDGNGFAFTPIGIMSCASGPSLVCGRRP